MMRSALAVVAAGLLSAGCQMDAVVAGEVRHETARIDLDPLKDARVELRMGAGELRVKSGTPKLVDAQFAFNVDAWKPVVSYHPEADRGRLTIAHPKGIQTRFGRTVNTWDVTLNEKLPLDVVADLGAGEADLELGQMNLRSVEVHIGAGQVKLDLRGEPKRSYDVDVRGGVGQATIYLPRDVAISATASGGLGSISATGLEKRDGVWINPERLQAPVTVHLNVKGGVGEIRLIR